MAAAWHSSSLLRVADLLVRGRRRLKDDEPGGVGGESMAWRSIRRSTHELEVVGGGLSVVGAVVASPFAPPPSPWPLLALRAAAAGSCPAFREFKQLAAAAGVVPPRSILGAVDLDALESLSAGAAPQQRVVQLLLCVQKLGAVRMEQFVLLGAVLHELLGGAEVAGSLSCGAARGAGCAACGS
jgi:hypothetical protein